MLRNRVVLIALMISILMSSFGFVYADDTLNGVGTENQVTEQVEEQAIESVEQTQTEQPVIEEQNEIAVPTIPKTDEVIQEVKSNAEAVGEMFSNAGVDEESIEAANNFIAPFARILNKAMAVILGITSLLMMLITVLDLLYMAFPPVRDLLDGGQNGPQQLQQQSRMGGMRGMRNPMGMSTFGGSPMDAMQGGMGMQGGFGGFSGQGQQANQKQFGGGLSAVGRWVSDEALAACIEAQGGVKSMLFSYMKKRSMFLILFGVCVVVFTSTVFTDLGIKLGMRLLQVIMGFGF